LLNVERRCHEEERVALEAEVKELRDKMANQLQEYEDFRAEIDEIDAERRRGFAVVKRTLQAAIRSSRIRRIRLDLRSRAKRHVAINDV
jgi:chromatin segregation and condensation protein Rec8/ScpA/Scc1 (kleisin family)